jgi:hypothetical protein
MADMRMKTKTNEHILHLRRSAMPRKRVVESFENAAACIGPIQKDMSLFAITRGQFSMIDAIFHVLHEAGPAAIPVWMRPIAHCEVEAEDGLMARQEITA